MILSSPTTTTTSSIPGSVIKDPTASLYSAYSVGFLADISLPFTPTDEVVEEEDDDEDDDEEEDEDDEEEDDEEEDDEDEEASEHSFHLFTALGQLFR